MNKLFIVEPGTIMAREAAIGFVIGGAFSAAITVVAFWGTPWLNVEAFNSDLMLQTLGVCIFTAIGVTLGARSKAAKGQWPIMERFSLLPNRLLLRLVFLTLAGLLVAALPMALAFAAVAPNGASFVASLVIKTIYGAILSSVIAALSVRAVMGERASRV